MEIHGISFLYSWICIIIVVNNLKQQRWKKKKFLINKKCYEITLG